MDEYSFHSHHVIGPPDILAALMASLITLCQESEEGSLHVTALETANLTIGEVLDHMTVDGQQKWSNLFQKTLALVATMEPIHGW